MQKAMFRCSLKLTLLSILCLLVSCGFTPLNKVMQENNAILAKIKVNKINAEKPYLLRAYLEDELNPRHDMSDQSLEINVTIGKAIEDILIKKDSTVTRKNLIATATFELRDLRKNKLIKVGNVKASASFAQVDSPFASFYTEEKAYNDVMKEIARTLTSHVIIVLQKKGL